MGQEKNFRLILDSLSNNHYHSIVSNYLNLIIINKISDGIELYKDDKINIIVINDNKAFDNDVHQNKIDLIDIKIFGKIREIPNDFIHFSEFFCQHKNYDKLFIYNFDIYEVHKLCTTKKIEKLDLHNREKTENNFIYHAGLNDYPQYNIFLFALINLVNFVHKKNFKPIFQFELSHDVDSLSGRDIYQISKRFFNILKFKNVFLNLKYNFINIIDPQKYHLRNIQKILDVENKHSLKSYWFILNGKKGRLHARTRTAKLSKLLGFIDKKYIGLHYNYNTFESEFEIKRQIDDFYHHFGFVPKIGRAHYLRLSSKKSFDNIYKFINHDQTISFVNDIGFKNSVSGTFEIYTKKLQTPLYAMDSNVIDKLDRLTSTAKLLNLIGGSLTVLLHHDYIYNDEHMDSYYLLENILEIKNKL